MLGHTIHTTTHTYARAHNKSTSAIAPLVQPTHMGAECSNSPLPRNAEEIHVPLLFLGRPPCAKCLCQSVCSQLTVLHLLGFVETQTFKKNFCIIQGIKEMQPKAKKG